MKPRRLLKSTRGVDQVAKGELTDAEAQARMRDTLAPLATSLTRRGMRHHAARICAAMGLTRRHPDSLVVRNRSTQIWPPCVRRFVWSACVQHQARLSVRLHLLFPSVRCIVVVLHESRHLPCLLTAQDKPGKHLPYDSPKLQRVRDYVQWAVTEGGVNERLVMNFDQAPP